METTEHSGAGVVDGRIDCIQVHKSELLEQVYDGACVPVFVDVTPPVPLPPAGGLPPVLVSDVVGTPPVLTVEFDVKLCPEFPPETDDFVVEAELPPVLGGFVSVDEVPPIAELEDSFSVAHAITNMPRNTITE